MTGAEAATSRVQLLTPSPQEPPPPPTVAVHWSQQLCPSHPSPLWQYSAGVATVRQKNKDWTVIELPCRTGHKHATVGFSPAHPYWLPRDDNVPGVVNPHGWLSWADNPFKVIIAFADQTAARCVQGKSWLAEAVRTWGVEVAVVEIDELTRRSWSAPSCAR